MAIDILTTTAKKYYEDSAGQGKQIDEFLFPTLDTSLNTTVKIDQYTGGGFAMRAIVNGQQARVREYSPGEGYEYTPPLYKEKTAIDESLRDSVVAGVEAASPQAQHVQQAVRHIVDGPRGFRAAARMTRAKAALDVYLTGVFTAYDGDSTITEHDYKRDPALTLNVDFTGSATQDSVLRNMYASLSAQGCPKNNLAVIMGGAWFANWESDSKVTAKRNATHADAWVQKNMQPPLLEGVEGLFVVGRYSIDGVAPPVWVLVYEPDWPYLAADGGTHEPFMPVDQALMFNIGGTGYRCNRGIDIVNGGAIQRAAGDLVIDSFTTDDPPAEWIRANARFMYLRGNINHTCVATGKFGKR